MKKLYHETEKNTIARKKAGDCPEKTVPGRIFTRKISGTAWEFVALRA
jgi:hypothetical protein